MTGVYALKETILTPGARSAVIVWGKGLPVHYLVFSDGIKTGGPVSLDTLHCTREKSHLSL